MSKKNIYDTALYLRLSRDDTDIDGKTKTESNSISSQRDLLRAYVQSHEDLQIFDIYIDATVIIGLKQNPTNGRRFSPIFYIIGHFVGQNTGCHYKPRRKTEYGTG